jgi:hypothetical protein
VGGYDYRLCGCEDYDVFLRIARTSPVYCHEKLIAEYRWHDSNASRNLGLMFRTAAEVLQRQRRGLRGDRERSACKDGLRKYRRMYGEPLLHEIFEDLHSGGRWGSALRGLWLLLWQWPGGTGWRVVRAFMHWVTRQARRKPA